MSSKLTYGDLFEHLRSQNCKITPNVDTKLKLYGFALSRWNLKSSNITDEFEDALKKKMGSYFSSLIQKWIKSNRSADRFIKKERSWLDNEFVKPILAKPKKKSKIGRPKKSFEELTSRSKQRKISAIASSISMPEAVEIMKYKFVKKGLRTESHILSTISQSHSASKELKKKLSDTKRPIPYTAQEALAFIEKNRFTKRQYVNIRLGAKKRNADIYPAYNRVSAEKNYSLLAQPLPENEDYED